MQWTVSGYLIFAVNVPLSVFAVVAAKRLGPGVGSVRSEEKTEVDLVGLILLAAGVTLVPLGTSQGGADGWGTADCRTGRRSAAIFAIRAKGACSIRVTAVKR